MDYTLIDGHPGSRLVRRFGVSLEITFPLAIPALIADVCWSSFIPAVGEFVIP